MDKKTDKHAIDELFARKLGSTSLPPSTNGFERLQARLQPPSNPRVTVWRNPALYRYGAAAACLLLAVLFGRLYLFTTNDSDNNGPIARRQSVKMPAEPAGRERIIAPKTELANETIAQTEQLGETERKRVNENVKPNRLHQYTLTTPTKQSNQRTGESERAVIAHQSTLVDEEHKSVGEGVNPSPEPRLADKTPTTAPAERVLVVTIAEPEALIAAREKAQAVIAEKKAVATVDQATDEQQPGKLWQQVRRIKSGEAFARNTNRDDEHGLLNRAYSGLKRSMDKDKSTRQ